MRLRLSSILLVGTVTAGCESPVSPALPSFEGEWAYTATVQLDNVRPAIVCTFHGDLVIDRLRASGNFAARTGGGAEPGDLPCGMSSGPLASFTIFAGTTDSAQFVTPTCTFAGRLVQPDSIDGSVVCHTPLNYSGTWSAARVGDAASIVITPVPGALAPGTTHTVRAEVRDARGHPLYGRVVNWASASAGVAMIAGDGHDGAVIHAMAAGTTIVSSRAGAIATTASVTVTSELFTAIAAGAEFTCALTPAGRPWCWGRNGGGQLGIRGTGSPALGPVASVTAQPFTQISSGDTHACASTGNDVYCWGDNNSGKLGVGDTLPRYAPTRVQASSLSRVSTGAFHTCAISAASAALCWGDNRFFQLGGGDSLVRSAAIPTPVASDRGFAAIASGVSHSCGIVSSGVAMCWGTPAFLLGTGTFSLSLSPMPVAGDFLYGRIAASSARTCALDPAGSVFCWGLKHPGELTGPDSIDLVPAAYASGRRFTAITTGGDHTCGLDAIDGTAWCWGANSNGQLGDGSTANRRGPVAVFGGRRYSSISAGRFHTCAIAPEGGAYCWGSNLVGQLGDGTTIDRATPVRVIGQPLG